MLSICSIPVVQQTCICTANIQLCTTSKQTIWNIVKVPFHGRLQSNVADSAASLCATLLLLCAAAAAAGAEQERVLEAMQGRA
jgi:hypothetical protein